MVVNTRNDDLDNTRPLDAIVFAAMPSERSAAERVNADSDRAVQPVAEETEPLTFVGQVRYMCKVCGYVACSNSMPHCGICCNQPVEEYFEAQRQQADIHSSCASEPVLNGFASDAEDADPSSGTQCIDTSSLVTLDGSAGRLIDCASEEGDPIDGAANESVNNMVSELRITTLRQTKASTIW